MVKYDNLTHKKLKIFTTVANKVVGEKVFELHYLGYKPGQSPKTGFMEAASLPYYEIVTDLINSTYNQYLKADDDIVYYHPNAIRSMFEKKNSSHCFLITMK